MSNNFFIKGNEIDRITMGDIMAKATALQDRCSDYNCGDLGMSFFNGTKLNYLDDSGSRHVVGLNDNAISQMAVRLGVPTAYASKMVNEKKSSLFEDNMNTWLREMKPGIGTFMREYRDEETGENMLRGILSPKFATYDTPEILDSIIYADPTEDYTVRGYYFDENIFHVRITGEDMKIPGEDLFPGLMITSSDVGRAALSIDFFIYKQVCTNGLVVSKAGARLFHHRHVGIDRSDFFACVSEAFKNYREVSRDMKEFVEKSRGRILTEEEFAKYTSDLTKKDQKKVNELMMTTYNRTKWGLINSITEAAQDHEIRDRLMLERVAGNILLAA